MSHEEHIPAGAASRRRQWPVPAWFPGYRREWLRLDVIAGLTAAAVVIPKAMAYAAVAGLPLEVGLYASLVPMVVYALIGTASRASYSVTTMMAILTAGEIARVAPGGDPATLIAAASTLSLLAGLFLLAGRALRLGFISDFISDPVLTGLKAAAGVMIIVDQIPKMLGIHFDKGHIVMNIASIMRHLSEISPATLILAATTLLLVIVLERRFPRSPAPLIAVALGLAVAVLPGIEQTGIELVGKIRPGLPPLVMPDLSLARQLWPGALGIALMSFIDTVTAGRAFVRHGEPRPAVNREMFAGGLANVAGSFVGAMPSAAGMAQTAVNSGAGARTQAAELVTAAVVGVTLLFLGPVIQFLPHATLAAVVVAVSLSMISPAEFRAIRRVRHVEFRWALISLVGILALGTMNGLLVAAAISVLTLFYQSIHPPVYPLARKPGTDVFRPLSPEHPRDQTLPGLLILRTEGRLHFANAQRAGDNMWRLVREEKPQVLLLDFSAVPDLEYTALKMLTDAEDRLRQGGVTVWLAALNPEVLKVIESAAQGQPMGHARVFANVEQAFEAYQGGLHQTDKEDEV